MSWASAVRFVVMYLSTASPVVLFAQGFSGTWLIIRAAAALSRWRGHAEPPPRPESHDAGAGWI